MNHASRRDHGTRIATYEDAAAATDTGALHMGRPLERIELLDSLFDTRWPLLAQIRTFADVATDDQIRLEIFIDKSRIETIEMLRSIDSELAMTDLTEDATTELDDMRSRYAKRLLSINIAINF